MRNSGNAQNEYIMENKDQLNQNSESIEGMENSTVKKTKKVIDGNEKKKIVKLIQPTILPGKVRVEVRTLENVVVAEDMIPQDETLPEIVMAEMEESDDEDDEMGEDAGLDLSALNKSQLVDMLEETVQDADVLKIKDKVSSIKVHFLKLNKEDRDKEMEQFILDGGEKENYEHIDDPLEVRFKKAFNVYKANKAKYNEVLDAQKLNNLTQKQAILEELKNLIGSEETLKKTYDEFRALQDRWKEIGQVPAGEITNLWNTYHFLVEKFFDKVKINRELRDLDLKKNLEAKIELCEKAEDLLLEKSLTKSFKLLQKYHDEWKEVGPVPQDKKEEIWERFKTATDKINQIRRDHYSKIQDEQNGNYETKSALCEKAEEIANEQPGSFNAWQKKSSELNELFKVWKSVGPAPKKQNDAIWARFKSAMDTFFSNKKEFFSKLKEQQVENYNRKLQLCAEAEALQESSEWKKATNELKRIQEEWKSIGPVPKRHSDKIWKRFRSACDMFFTRKSEFFLSVKGEEDANLTAKKELIERIKAYEIKKDRSENMDAIKALQRQWVEIGHVPIKVKDSINAEYRKAVDALFDKMKINENEISTNEYREMVGGMREDPESRDKMRRERNTLSAKIQRLRDEISVLENNIGFFSNSKQSEIMKAEYEKKINRAKNDLKMLEAKQKILNE
jgi:Domain of Unknown Function (DUF349).